MTVLYLGRQLENGRQILKKTENGNLWGKKPERSHGDGLKIKHLPEVQGRERGPPTSYCQDITEKGISCLKDFAGSM
jgi:hypothetical protein